MFIKSFAITHSRSVVENISFSAPVTWGVDVTVMMLRMMLSALVNVMGVPAPPLHARMIGGCTRSLRLALQAPDLLKTDWIEVVLVVHSSTAFTVTIRSKGLGHVPQNDGAEGNGREVYILNFS